MVQGTLSYTKEEVPIHLLERIKERTCCGEIQQGDISARLDPPSKPLNYESTTTVTSPHDSASFRFFYPKTNLAIGIYPTKNASLTTHHMGTQ